MEPGLDEDAISRHEPDNSRTDLVDDARTVGPRDLRERNVRDAIADEDVEMVHRSGPDGDDDLARTGLRVRPVAVLEDLVAPVLPEEHGFHRLSSSIPAI